MSNKSKKAILLAGICTGSLLWGESTNAQTCTPAPDCESLGYNQSSCPGGFLRCPFDASKLSCMPDCNLSITAEQCASECREVGSLSCVKDGVTYYSECGESLCKGTEQCEKGSTNADGALEPGLCVPGGLGGILYSDMTVSNEIVSGKTAIGVIVSGSGDGRQRLAMSLKDSGDLKWGSSNSNLPISDYALKEDALKDQSGKENTKELVREFGDSSQHAGGYCYNYTTSGTKKGSWYLSAMGELYEAFYVNGERVKSTLGRISGAGVPVDTTMYWSSSERDMSTAWGGKFGVDFVDYSTKTSTDKIKKARCFFEVSYNDDGTVSPVCDSGYHWENSVCTPDCGEGEYWNGSGCVCRTEYNKVCSPTSTISGGLGTECGGKYASCSCVQGASWNGSDCVCNSSYKYSCDGAGEIPDPLNECGGKYKVCGCKTGYYWSNGACKVNCSNLCDVGNIYYSDKTCSSCYNTGKTPIGVIALKQGKARLIMNLSETALPWSPTKDEIAGMGSSAGKTDTTMWVNYYGSGYTEYAAGYCYNYTTAGTTQGQWFLPSAEEYEKIATGLTAVNRGLQESGSVSLSGEYYTVTSESKDKAKLSNGGSSDKSLAQKTRCLLYAEVNDANTSSSLCSTAYKYACAGEGYLCGMGETCGWLFQKCECAEGYYNSNNYCLSCQVSCDEVGSIYYSDGTCSTCQELSKTPVGIVAYKDDNKRLMISLENIKLPWSATSEDIPDLPNLATIEEAKADMDGKKNTKIIVDYYGADADSSTNAAVYCYNYAPIGMEDSKGQWYLPAVGELYFRIYNNWSAIYSSVTKLGASFTPDMHWSSSEYNTKNAWYMYPSNATAFGYNKQSALLFRCVLAF